MGTKNVRLSTRAFDSGEVTAGTFGIVFATRKEEHTSLCLSEQHIRMELQWAGLLPSMLYAPPNPADSEINSRLLHFTRIQVIEHLARDYPQSVKLLNGPLDDQWWLAQDEK